VARRTLVLVGVLTLVVLVALLLLFVIESGGFGSKDHNYKAAEMVAVR
jgi:hypothetical protein